MKATGYWTLHEWRCEAARQQKISRRAVAVALAVSVVAAVACLFAPAEASPRAKAKVTYIRCGAGNVHIWLYGDNGIFVMPAGSDCP